MTEPQARFEEVQSLQGLRKGDLIRTDWIIYSRKAVCQNSESEEFAQRWDLTNYSGDVVVEAGSPLLVLDFDVKSYLVHIIFLHGETVLWFGVNLGIFYRDYRRLECLYDNVGR